MKIAIISDIHANFDALRAFPENYDELWVLGDLVNYGPQPSEVVDRIMKTADIVVRGNHDHAVASTENFSWKPRWREASEAMTRYTRAILTNAQKAFISSLPLQLTVERRGASFFLTHATPSNPLHGHLLPDSAEWASEVKTAGTDVLLVGHSHLPFIRKIGEGVVINPGSIGQPRHGNPRASYAIWDDGKCVLKTYRYPIEKTIRRIRGLSLPRIVTSDLVSILRTGSI